MTLPRILFLALLSLNVTVAFAARPMITDDARIVDPQACQVETWHRKNGQGQESWALPACNPTGNLELTVGGASLDDGSGSARTLVRQMQGKTILRPLQTGGWGMGLALGVVQKRSAAAASTSEAYTYVPMTLSTREDKTFYHLNLGLSEDKSAPDTILRKTWGTAIEHSLTEKAWLIMETFGQSGKPAQFQFGLRYWIIPNRMQIDTTYGNRLGNSNATDQWMSIGLRILTPSF